MIIIDEEEDILIVDSSAKQGGIAQMFKNCFIRGVNYEENRIIKRDVLEEEDCAICLERLFDNEPITSEKVVESTSCMHVFHLHCIIKWTQINKTCPVCRLKIHQLDVITCGVSQKLVDQRDIVENKYLQAT
ncbi:hypothetical protein F8388_021700 [Cannabis sativa]|uniref:RING-type E3 ubiquitin transferase n=1 Tax=Cannabis sativa TaxID=3483 RepID=A0A7J6DXX2_CANSA|nr:hypothetical protein F8388_021700 [Cannabis sativa]KAF4355097.1 hypothetical protein G4B88_004309 [Cannabis sativa]